MPPAIDPTERLLTLASIVRGEGSAQRACAWPPILRGRSTRCWSRRSTRAGSRMRWPRRSDLAAHWEKSLDEAEADLRELAATASASKARSISPSDATGCSHRLADGGRTSRRAGFTVAAGITTAAPAVAALVARVARMPEGMVVLPGLVAARTSFPTRNGRRSARTRTGAAKPTHPQFHLKLLLDRLGVARERGAAVALVRRRGIVASARRARSPMRWPRRTSRTNGRR